MITERFNTWLNLGANIGLIVTLLFLAFEINQSTKATEAAASNSVVDGFNSLNMSVISDPQVARTFIVGLHEPEALSDVEAVQFAMWMRSFVNQHIRLQRLAKLRFYSEAARLPDLQQLAGMLSTPGGKLYLESNKDIFPQDLLSEIQPFLGHPLNSDFKLGREDLSFE